MDRRTFLSLSAVAAASPLAGSPVTAQSAAPAAAKPSAMERLAAAIAGARMPLDFGATESSR